jgi:glycosyltransferase involved in cell wall biosynthesis
MRIALLVPAPFATVSGGYAYDRRIVAGLREAGHDVAVVELTGRHPVPDPPAREAAEHALANVAADTRIVIDGLGLPSFGALAGVLAERGATALVHHPTAIETGRGDAERDELRRTECALLPRCRRAIATSVPTARQLTTDFGVESDRITVVVPGTDDAPRSTGSVDGTCHILSVGALIPRKGYDVLFRALVRLVDLDWKLTIAGSTNRDAAHATGLAALADELGIARRVRFAGETVDAALDLLWQSADMFASATYWEGYGMAIAEAIKRGLPVAVTAGGAATDLVAPSIGVTAPPGEPDVLSKAMRRIIFDVELRREMAEAAWHVGQTLPDWRGQAARFAEALA